MYSCPVHWLNKQNYIPWPFVVISYFAFIQFQYFCSVRLILTESLLDSLEYADQSRYINEFLQLKKFCLHYQRWLGGKFHVQQVVHMLCELSKLYTYKIKQARHQLVANSVSALLASTKFRNLCLKEKKNFFENSIRLR